MRIAQVAPLYERVPPTGYGGTERVVYYLTEELVAQGHEVTLFASGDSKTNARLIAGCEKALRTDPNSKLPLLPHLLQLDDVLNRAHHFDIIHFHTDPYHFPFLSRLQTPTITTIHGRLDFKEYQPFIKHFNLAPLVSISDSQRTPLPFANWSGTIHHGLPNSLYRSNEKRGDYLAFLGRLSPEKRVDRAIEIAVRLGLKLKIAAKLDPNEMDYFKTHIEHLLDQPGIEYIGEIGESEKQEFLSNALALLFPIDWPEPFGMVMIEAMACGTPTIAFKNGSVPEIIRNGVNGFIVSDVDEAVSAVQQLDKISRRQCRSYFDAHFSIETMTYNYLLLYQDLVQNRNRLVRETVLDMNLQRDSLAPLPPSPFSEMYLQET